MKDILKKLTKYKIQIMIIIIFIFVQVIAELFMPTIMADIVDVGITTGDTKYILFRGAIMLGVALIGVVGAIIGGFFSSKVSSIFGCRLRNEIFEKVTRFSLDEFDEKGTASFITRTTNDVTQIQQFVYIMLRMFLRAPIMCIGGIIMAVSKNAKLSIVFLLIVPLIALAIFIVAKLAFPLFNKMQKKLDRLNLVLREQLTGIRVIRAFNRSKYEKNKFKTANEDLRDVAIKVNKLTAALMPVMMLIMNLTTVIIIWFGAIQIDNGNMQVGDLMAFVQYAMQILFSFIMVSMLFIMFPRAQASAKRINEVLSMEKKLEVKKEDNISKDIISIEFENVDFRYKGAEEKALRNINLYAEKGDTIAIIGGTGAGKSTLINLIPRFYDIEKGKIKINNEDYRNYSVESIRKEIGYVPQKSVLFSGSVKENVVFGSKKDNSRVEEVIELSQSKEFVDNMSEKTETFIAQGGKNISGGQKQRLSIARAIYKKPSIYLFDDSFSALDFKTDAKLRSALKNEMQNSISFIVAQRVSTIMNFSKIVVLNEGEIVGMGKHKELLKNCDVYKEIVNSQLSEEELLNA